MTRVLTFLLCVNIFVTTILLLNVKKVTNQYQEVKETLNSAVETINIFKTIIAGGLIDKAQLVKKGIDHVKQTKFLRNIKDRLFNVV